MGKFDLTKYTNFGTKRYSSVKNLAVKIKPNNIDDAIRVAAELPGPG